MNTIELMRSAHVLPYIQAARVAWPRIDEDSGFASLRALLGPSPDGCLPKAALIDCLRAIAEGGALRDLGYLAFRRWRPSCLDADVLARVRRGRTLRERLGTLSDVCAVEDTQLRIGVRHEGNETRIVLNEGELSDHGFQYAEWIQIAVALGTIRDALGLRLQPRELTFQSRYRPSAEMRAELRDVRLVSGAPCTSIAIGASLLDISIVAQVLPSDPQVASRIESRLRDVNGGLASRLKMLLRGYLGEVCPTIRLAAALARTSVRSLQRELARSGVSYSGLVQQVRFERATRMLRDERTKVIEIALSLGYKDASHFSRAFRRAAGMSPRQYRRARQLPESASCADAIAGIL